MKWMSFLVLMVLFVVGCASPLERGNQQYALGNYNQAASFWNPAAQAGDPSAQFNLGLLWESGLGSTPKNLNEAANWFALSAKQGYVPAMVKLAKIQFELGYGEAGISWLNLAARWNNVEAQTILKSKGLVAPYPDLYEQKQINEDIALQNYATILSGVVSAYSSTLTPTATSSYQNTVPVQKPTTSYQNTTSVQKSTTSYQNTTPVQQPTSSYQKTSAVQKPQIYTPTQKTTLNYQSQNSISQEPKCSSDYSCGIGFQCVKAPLQSTGVCMKSVNEYGTKEFRMPNSNSVGPNMNTNGQCSFSTDCPIGFNCDSKLKACVKK